MRLEETGFVGQSLGMNPKWAEENLQTIRTLMERSAVYRRALAPIMIFVGAIGIGGGILGDRLVIHSDCGFVLFWSGVAAVALSGTFLMVRRQALKDSEPVWSSPTKRVAQALIPHFTVGIVAAASIAYENDGDHFRNILICIWCSAFGCAIHSAGFFMPRGMKLLGWLFIFAGILVLINLQLTILVSVMRNPNFVMAAIFGGLHLAYGIYLYFTEKKSPNA